MFRNSFKKIRNEVIINFYMFRLILLSSPICTRRFKSSTTNITYRILRLRTQKIYLWEPFSRILFIQRLLLQTPELSETLLRTLTRRTRSWSYQPLISMSFLKGLPEMFWQPCTRSWNLLYSLTVSSLLRTWTFQNGWKTRWRYLSNNTNPSPCSTVEPWCRTVCTWSKTLSFSQILEERRWNQSKLFQQGQSFIIHRV